MVTETVAMTTVKIDVNKEGHPVEPVGFVINFVTMSETQQLRLTNDCLKTTVIVTSCPQPHPTERNLVDAN